MTEVRRMLSDEERAEYDALLYEATHHSDGKRRKTREIGPRLQTLLNDAEQAGRRWAGWVLDDALLTGLQATARKWSSTREVIETIIGERIVRKPAAYGIRRARSDGGQDFLRAGWGEMTAEDLDQLISSRGAQIAAERDTVTIARKLKKLLTETGKTPVSVALESLGVDLTTYLASAA